jgi:predicted RNase H-like HicB family nuclease
MYRIWYWAMIDRETDGRFVASIPDLDDVSAWGASERDAVTQVADLAAERIRSAVEEGRQVPRRRHLAEIPVPLGARQIGRAIIPVEVARTSAWPTPPYDMSG